VFATCRLHSSFSGGLPFSADLNRTTIVEAQLRAGGNKSMPGTTIESFVDDIAKRSNIDPAAAETAVGTILSVIQQEGNPSKVSQLFDHLPGAVELAQKYAVVPGSGAGVGGTLSGLASKVIGADAGVMVAALAQLSKQA
jgi:hypothetical protein